MIMLTQRDLQVVDFVRSFKSCRASSIQKLFYPNKRKAQDRLKEAFEAKQLKRSKFSIYGEYVYYVKTPSQLQHNLLLTDFIAFFSTKAKLISCRPEFTCGCVRADAVIIYNINGRDKTAFIEVQLSGPPDLLKYKELLHGDTWRRDFSRFPDILLITNERVNKCGLDNVAVFDTNFKIIN